MATDDTRSPALALVEEQVNALIRGSVRAAAVGYLVHDQDALSGMARAGS